MKKIWLVLIITGVAILSMIIVCCLLTYIFISKEELGSKCYPLPKDFSELELVGTWEGGWPGQTDTLVIRGDGTYKQKIHIRFAEGLPIDYESGWQNWHLEYSKYNIAYLHLDGFRFCGMNPDISCEERIGGGYDFCRDETIHMVNEGILIVLAAQDDRLPETEVPKYNIHLDFPLGSENSWIYSLQEH